MVAEDSPDQRLGHGARMLVRVAHRKREEYGHAQLSVNHWLLALVERHGAMLEQLSPGLKVADLRQRLEHDLREGNTGEALPEETVVSEAIAHAESRGVKQAFERDIAIVILERAGYSVPEEPLQSQALADLNDEPSSKSFASAQEMPVLKRFGVDLTEKARDGKLSPVVGREEEIQLVIETLCRRQKRNPLLVGPAGVGKTAIVEGLAQRISAGQVPQQLRKVRIVALQPSVLVAEASLRGDLEQRMQAILREASQPGIILFIDEIHSMIGAGGKEGIDDVASLLKPAIAREDIACIGATTDEEYRFFIQSDSALERRFQPIRVQELSPEQTLLVLDSVRKDIEKRQGVQVQDGLLRWMVDFAQDHMRNRRFPDKAIDLLDQCVAYAVTQGEREVTREDAQIVAERMVGMPTNLSEKLMVLKSRLMDMGPFKEEDIEALVHRLGVTMRGLDLRPQRPNSVVLLAGEAVDYSEQLAEVIAESLFGDVDRVVNIDFSRFVRPADLSMLIGSGPGYVGYRDTLEIHRIAQMPWCVFQCENIHACHPNVLGVLQNALRDGFFTDGAGKRVYLSDVVVLMTAQVPSRAGSLGLRQNRGEPAGDLLRGLREVLGEEILAVTDFVWYDTVPQVPDHSPNAIRQLLAELSRRFQSRGVHLRWDDAVIAWISEHGNNRDDWERLIEERLIPLIAECVPGEGEKEVVLYTESNQLAVRELSEKEQFYQEGGN